jgi:hypothetical protein
MPRLISILVACFAALSPIPAEAFAGRNGTSVNPINDDVFEVITRTAGSTSDYWCGASEYARRELGAGWQDRLYVVQGRGPSVTTNRRTAVQFTLSPDAAGVVPLTSTFRLSQLQVGDNMSIQMANQQCAQRPVRP